MQPKSFLLALFVLFSLSAKTQSLSPERVTKIKNCTVRILIDSTPIGTGFLINDKGFVLTCWHVANFQLIRNLNGNAIGARHMYIELNGGDKIEVGIANYFANAGNKEAVAYDYCLVVPITSQKITNPTPYFKLGDFGDVSEGDEIYTCGYPFGIPQQFISKGMVSTKYTDKTNSVITNGKTDTLKRNQALLDLTMNRGNSGGPMIKLGKTIDEDVVIGIADFIITPVGKDITDLISDLNKSNNSGGSVIIMGINPNESMAKITQVLTNISVGISGCISIEYPKLGLAAAGL